MTTKSEAKTATKPAAAAAGTPKLSRKTVKAKGRVKRKERLVKDKEFAKAYFAAKSKRSVDKKAAFRKKKTKKK
ncbi:hypothetical protein WDW86_07905 [Bdellovibrionota bacterium FG-2]